MTREHRAVPWTSAWLDAVAFAAGLGVAWASGWTARDLVWSLWLSSLVVGYAMILWRIVRPIVVIAHGAWTDRAFLRQVFAEHNVLPGLLAMAAIAAIAGLFMLAFFTVHFGGFHFVHSQFLAMFFPLSDAAPRMTATWETYAEVGRRYWTFLPAAFLAERAAFVLREAKKSDDRSVTAAAIAARKAAAGRGLDGMMAPYRNVLRMHMLIFFFAFASFAALDHFAIYAVVYAVYFFPWRLLRRDPTVPPPAGHVGRPREVAPTRLEA